MITPYADPSTVAACRKDGISMNEKKQRRSEKESDSDHS